MPGARLSAFTKAWTGPLIPYCLVATTGLGLAFSSALDFRPNYASLLSGDAYSYWHLTPNFELWVDFFFCGDMSAYPYPEKRNHASFPNISPAVVIDTWTEKSSRVLQHMEYLKFPFFSEKVEIEFWLWLASQYQSNSSNWNSNGNVFTSISVWEDKNLI